MPDQLITQLPTLNSRRFSEKSSFLFWPAGTCPREEGWRSSRLAGPPLPSSNTAIETRIYPIISMLRVVSGNNCSLLEPLCPGWTISPPNKNGRGCSISVPYCPEKTHFQFPVAREQRKKTRLSEILSEALKGPVRLRTTTVCISFLL